MDGFLRKWMGKMGALGVLYVIHVSYRPKMRKRDRPVVRVPIMTLLLQAWDTPASCSAKMSGMGQQTERMPPCQSRLRILSLLVLPSLRGGMDVNRITIAMATTGPLRKKIHRQVLRSEMMPPSKGPSRLAMAKTEEMTPE